MILLMGREGNVHLYHHSMASPWVPPVANPSQLGLEDLSTENTQVASPHWATVYKRMPEVIPSSGTTTRLTKGHCNIPLDTGLCPGVMEDLNLLI